ncbi:MAG: D-alanyl-D-alanine carboxypeptidase family protein [Sporolactobacillus sp.]|uniref:D-alanyl-D-alanine carboxypeptidase family protein n=1 Tax=Sporolactobacillus sp. STSJ-5 TaxID=2965076 RepID=UPI002106E151|nr:D-alanyl-D-alanine carboxypeptidase family protein [Sporolactobacillus sp. STSJ-5]MCQ2010062.1 D-alanyl-D-alanine carboxypeptidase [Sporolactobacillus sp. STSJ-5]
MLKRVLFYLFCFIFIFAFFPHQSKAAEPKVSAQSAVLMDQTSGRVLFKYNSNEKLPIASITKVMTAILAIESGKMNKTFTVSQEALRTEGSSIYLKAGEKMKLKDMVYGLMLRSGNDASRAIAEAVGGSESGFVLMMNEKAHVLGMTNSHFTNPNGLENPDHYSTAYDMALLMRYAMDNAQFRKVVGTRIHRVPATNKEVARAWKNKNKMLRLYKYSTGGKTGFTKKARRTLISTASKNHLNLIAVTLNDGDDWQDHQGMFEWAFARYKAIQVIKKGKLNAHVHTFYQNKLYVQRSVTVPLTNNEKKQLKKNLLLIKPKKDKHWKPASPAGRLNLYVEQKKLASLPVYYHSNYKEKKGFWSRFSGFLHAIVTGDGR